MCNLGNKPTKMRDVMNKEIKRMTTIIGNVKPFYVETIAEALYNAGYRKIENANGHNLPHEIDYLLTEFDEMGFAPTSLCDNPEGKAKLWKSALVYEIGLLLDEYAAIKEKAVKEFAEKVKAKSYVNDYCREVVEIEKIDELLKEYE